MPISIFTITHVPFTPPNDPIYIPLQVGHAIHENLGYLTDNTGDNISDKNQCYSELTGLYWIWKNYTDADYLGLCHYRRYFLNSDGKLMTESDYMDILSRYDVIIAKSCSMPYDYRTVYGRSHNIHNLDKTEEIIKRICPDYYETFQQVIADTHCYIGNLFVAPKALFHDYCKWLFAILSSLEAEIDVSGYDDYHKRVFGFLSEQLLMVWIRHNHLTFYESLFGLSQEKAETIWLKQNIREYLLQGDIDHAYQCLCDTLDKRPDLLLELSDFKQELTSMEHILNICRVEEDAGLPTLLCFSRDYDVLIKHFHLLLNILEKIKSGTVSNEEILYLIDCRISYKGIIYIIQNFTQLSSEPLKLLNQLSIIYANAGHYLTALSFLESALSIHETDRLTLSNIVSVLENMGHPEMTCEYKELLHSLPGRRIVLCMGHSIPVLAYIAEQYALALESLGHTVFRFDMRFFERSFESLLIFQSQGLDAAIVFNNACFQMRMQSGESLWDLWKVPCSNIIVDHPMHYFDTLDHAPVHGIVACADRYHLDYIKRFYPAVKRSVFLPTAGTCLKAFEDLKPFRERPIDVLFIGSYKYHYDIIYDEFDKKLEQALLLYPAKTFEENLEDCLRSEDIHLSDAELKIFIQNHRYIDTNTTALFRARILQILADAGITVTVYGNGWDTLDLFRHPNFHYKGLITPEDGVSLMEDSKIVLNHMAWFKAGASERIFEAMLQGAVSLTDDSSFLREVFQDNITIKFYSLENLNALPEIVYNLLSNTLSSEEITRNAYQAASQKHTWSNRIKSLDL